MGRHVHDDPQHRLGDDGADLSRRGVGRGVKFLHCVCVVRTNRLPECSQRCHDRSSSDGRESECRGAMQHW
jgi:hypothetical protein